MKLRIKLSINATIKSMMFLSKKFKDLNMKDLINNLQIIRLKKRVIYTNQLFNIKNKTHLATWTTCLIMMRLTI